MKLRLCFNLIVILFVLELSAQTNTNISNFQAYIPSSYMPNKSYSVGEIRYSQQVLPNGSVCINVPMETANTPNSFAPSISFDYNSMSSSEAMGRGWSLSYGSIISKSNQTYYYDGCSKGYCATDVLSAYYLDGQRMIGIDSCDTHIEYKCLTGYDKVYAYHTNGNINSFEVHKPNGIKNIYSINDGVNFYIVKSIDALGNEITYTYNQAFRPFLPTTIKYGKEDEACISFYYQELNDNFSIEYYNGLIFQYKLLPTQITSTINGLLWRSYNFEYTINNGNVLLSEIYCKVSDDNDGTINPIKLYYNDYNEKPFLQEENYNLPNNYITISPPYQIIKKGKFEYGTEMDAFLHLTKKISYKKSNGKIVNEYTLDSLTDYNISVSSLPASGNNMYTSNDQLYADNGFIDCICMDVDDIPGDEIVVINNIVKDGVEKLSFKTYKTSITNILNNKLTVSNKYQSVFSLNTLLSTNSGENFVTPKDFHQGDFNGDGRMDILAMSSSNTLGYGNIGKCYIFDIKNEVILYEGAPIFFNMVFPENNNDVNNAYRSSDKLYIIDFDGDSKSDICHINNNGMHIYTFETLNDSLHCNYISTYPGIDNNIFNKNNDRLLLMGEFNGDGKTDFILSSSKNASTTEKSKWLKFLSKGDGTWDSSYYSYLFDYDNEVQYFLQDMNNDGISDIVRNSSRNDSTYIGVWLLDNNITQTESSNNSYYELEYTGGLYFVPSDIQNKNFSNNILALRSTFVKRYYLGNSKYGSQLLTGIISSNGLIHKYSYRRLIDNEDDTFYQQGYNAKFPYFNYRGPLTVCDRNVTILNNEALSDKRYKYTNAVGHKQGLGLLGFEKFESFDAIRNETDKVYFSDTCHFRLPIYTSSKRDFKDYTYNISIAPNKTAKIELTEIFKYDKMYESEDTIRYTYDVYGNVASESHRYYYDHSEYPNNSTCWQKTIYSYKNIINDSIYILGLPLTSTITTNNGGTNKDVKRMSYTYNDYGQVLTKTYANMPSSSGSEILRAAPPSTPTSYNISKETYSYDNKHSLIKKSLKKYTSANTFDELYTYYNNGAIHTKTDSLGLTETYVYDELGRLKEVHDYRNNATIYTYDNWGRKNKTIYPEMTAFPSTVKIEYINASDNFDEALTKITKTDKYEYVEYYNALGQKIRTREECFDGTLTYTDFKYDIYGRMTHESYPYKINDTIKWKSFQYDKFDRLSKIEYASGKFEETKYDGYIEETTIDSICTITDYNPFGDILKVENYDLETWQNTGTINISYVSKGKPYSIIPQNGSQIYFSYDNYGRCSMVDKSHVGKKTFTYNDIGEVESIKESNGLETNYSYDRYGRIINKSSTYTGNVSYTYNSFNDIIKKTYDNNRSVVIAYDNYGRIKNEKETGYNGTSLSIGYTYDSATGNILSETDSVDGSEIICKNYIYDTSNKFLKQITAGNNIIWQLNKKNVSGNVIEEITGPLKRTYLYDIDGNPISLKITRKDNSTGDSVFVQNFAYNISPLTKNLISRTDVTRNITEQFAYDNLNRLISFNNKEIEYDNIGNIKYLEGVGTYEYQSSNPYAVTSINLTGNNIPNNVQNITYNAQGRVASIQEGNLHGTFYYTGEGNRIRMTIRNGVETILDRQYLTSGIYEKDITPQSIKERLYLNGDPYTATSVITRSNNGAWGIQYICRDNLGSITHITDSEGNILQELSYDAWGNLRSPSTHSMYSTNNQPTLLLGRGFTGHEHLPSFGLINMNARMYDPVIARFLSPDPYVQEKKNLQNYNSYSYCLNNPLKYTDKSGELLGFVWELFNNTIIRPWTEGFNAWTDSDNWHATKNTFKLINGLFAGNLKQIISRLTWELPQTMIGYTISYLENDFGRVKNVGQYRGATAVTLYSNKVGRGTGITLGSYIIGNNKLRAEAGNYLFMHEYGHYLQSQDSGLFYLSNFGLPSIIPNGEPHDEKDVEEDANARAAKFFYYKIGYDVTNFIRNFKFRDSDSVSPEDAIKNYPYQKWYETLYPKYW